MRWKEGCFPPKKSRSPRSKERNSRSHLKHETVRKNIPDICHLDHLHVGGEKNCHVEKFQISIHGISSHEEEFQFFHTTDVEKCEFLPNLVKFHISPQDRCEEI